MPSKTAVARAKKDAKRGKSPSTQAGEFVREEMHKIRRGEHGAKNPKQAIAIGLSEARRAGVKLKQNPNRKSKSPERKRKGPVSKKRSHATLKALKREPTSSASHRALSRHAHKAAKRRSASSRHEVAMKAVHTKGHAGLRRAARKAAHTREQHAHHA
jgi:hypothetical protein